MKENLIMDSKMDSAMKETPLYTLKLVQGDNQVNIKIRECDIYSFIQDHKKSGIKRIEIDLKKYLVIVVFNE